MIALLRFSLAIAFVSQFPLSSASAHAASGDRELALRSLADMRAANASIVRTEDGNAVGRRSYQTAALQARNALIGRTDRDYVKKAGDPGDGVGAIGYIDHLLDRSATQTWTDGLRGAKINLLAAAQSLTDALGAKQMEEYETDLTGALADISLAMGRPSQAGVLGGVEGALATTSLGVPAGSKIVSGCSATSDAPAFGVTAGKLAYMSVARGAASTALPSDFPVRRIDVVGNRLVLYTNSASEAAQMCAHRTASVDAHRQLTRAVASPATLVSYTAAQAHAGAAVYAQNCLSCHGANLQGVAAPAVAGKTFVSQVTGNGWSVADLRNLVVQQMPLNNPGTLNPKQYADVIAYLLASNCYAAGNTPFPKNDDPKLAKIKIRAPHGAKPTNARFGICSVK